MDAPDRPSARFLKLTTIGILVVGLGAAIAVYFVASERPENPLGYDPLDTKKYLHDLEMYGGKANVLATEFREWFVGLWYGKNLAFTIAVITVLLVVAFRFVVNLRARAMTTEDTDDFVSRIDRGPGPHRL